MSAVIELHILQSVPPSNLNRDDTGSPKTAVYGGVRRHRVSSQSWKRATRQHFAQVLDTEDLGYRTKRVVDLVADRVQIQAPEVDRERALVLSQAVVVAAGLPVAKGKKEDLETGALTFVSSSQLNRLAEIAVLHIDAQDVDKALKEDKDHSPKSVFKEENSIDIALFGRMVASSKDLNVDAACQVAHAISTHAAEVEYDYYTAIDDFKANDSSEDAGAGMIGTVEFTSSTLYRYANVNLDRLHENLGDSQATIRAVEALVQAFALSMPSGKSNTFANSTIPDVYVVTVRDERPVNLVNAYETPVVSNNGYRLASAQRLAAATKEAESAFVSPPLARFVVATEASLAEATAGLGERVSLSELTSRVGELVRERLGDA